jgi:NADH dehydrogenase FAD-containing subunit
VLCDNEVGVASKRALDERIQIGSLERVAQDLHISLSRQPDAHVRVFLIGDGAACAHAHQKLPHECGVAITFADITGRINALVANEGGSGTTVNP